VAAVCASLLLLVPGLLRRGALGMGDVKLAGVLGAALGGKVLAALTLGSLASAPVALFLLLRSGKGRSATLPFGPFLTLGTAVVLLA
jgi:leader peptidase (prepilin peptidase)/N-methyltransferase